MVPNGPWVWKHRTESDQRKEVIDNTAITALPIPEDGHPGTYLEIENVMLNAYSKNIDQAWELIKIITDKNSQKFLLNVQSALPSRRDVEVDSDTDLGKWLGGFLEQIPTARAVAQVNWEPTREDILDAIQLVLYDKNTPEEAAEWLYDSLQKRIEKGEI
jgi:ABC-type glycerol-3-phosphate transport system substrate-binding protein